MKGINLTREEALELPIMKHINKTGYYIDLPLQEINKLMGFNLKRDYAVANRLLSYKANNAGIFAIFEYGNHIKIMVNPKIVDPDFNKETVFDIPDNF